LCANRQKTLIEEEEEEEEEEEDTWVCQWRFDPQCEYNSIFYVYVCCRGNKPLTFVKWFSVLSLNVKSYTVGRTSI